MTSPSRSTSSLSLRTRVTIPDGVLSQPLDNETVLLHLGTGTYFGLDPVGTRIWSLLKEGRALEEIHATLCEEYAAAPDALSCDLLKFVNNLAEQQLIQYV